MSYLLDNGLSSVFDPAVGAGAFFHAAKQIAHERGNSLRLAGTEIDPQALVAALRGGLDAQDLVHVRVTDFLLGDTPSSIPAIVANPPYIRHHRLTSETKAQLRALCQQITGFTIDGRAGLHIYFLLRALSLLAPHGRLAFIMPADTVEGVFAAKLWQWITSHFCLDAVVTFEANASPFPRVDTNAIIFLIRNDRPSKSFWWARCHVEHPSDLKHWVANGFNDCSVSTLSAVQRTIEEGLHTGLSRPPSVNRVEGPCLSDYARIVRGIATGANEFFFLTRKQVEAHRIPPGLLRSALGRTRDVPGDVITAQTLEDADTLGRPTLLFAPDSRPLDEFPPTVRTYLEAGIRQGLPSLSLIAQRKPWYKMETRAVPPFLFAYLGRRNARFIRNEAGVLPLTSFLCVYPHRTDAPSLNALWLVLSHPTTIQNLALVGKSYGDGAIKVEPRALERLPLMKAPYS